MLVDWKKTVGITLVYNSTSVKLLQSPNAYTPTVDTVAGIRQEIEQEEYSSICRRCCSLLVFLIVVGALVYVIYRERDRFEIDT